MNYALHRMVQEFGNCADMPIIFCGDFNSPPTSIVVNFMYGQLDRSRICPDVAKEHLPLLEIGEHMTDLDASKFPKFVSAY